jgi:hypothetical protein
LFVLFFSFEVNPLFVYWNSIERIKRALRICRLFIGIHSVPHVFSQKMVWKLVFGVSVYFLKKFLVMVFSFCFSKILPCVLRNYKFKSQNETKIEHNKTKSKLKIGNSGL